jgi:hypothetical protein
MSELNQFSLDVASTSHDGTTMFTVSAGKDSVLCRSTDGHFQKPLPISSKYESGPPLYGNLFLSRIKCQWQSVRR